MESQISHNIASRFSSSPKESSKNTLNNLIILRMLYLNDVNIANSYTNQLNNNKKYITINSNFTENNNYIDNNYLTNSAKKELSNILNLSFCNY